ncbi:MAG: hypothetical protein C0465_00615 [Ralstonia sp.]|nr:hypothetical protein [Ralstonia sp.]MBA4229133.1 hypothetical protein [Ralstonia sp.]MBA4234319.1 hypothetical protein [Ralstonia sp.]MBA4400696.1 hypothetical protein [Ralstonia sp.]
MLDAGRVGIECWRVEPGALGLALGCLGVGREGWGMGVGREGWGMGRGALARRPANQTCAAGPIAIIPPLPRQGQCVGRHARHQGRAGRGDLRVCRCSREPVCYPRRQARHPCGNELAGLPRRACWTGLSEAHAHRNVRIDVAWEPSRRSASLGCARCY